MLNIMNSTIALLDKKQKQDQNNDVEAARLLQFGKGSAWYSEENTKSYVERFSDSTGAHK